MPRVRWTQILRKVPDGFIAMVNEKSTLEEKQALGQFSDETKEMFGIWFYGRCTPFITEWAWYQQSRGEPRPLCAFVAVVRDKVVGYAVCRWHYRITDNKRNVLRLETWCVEVVFVLPDFRRRGLGQALLRSAADALGVELEDLAVAEPILPPGAALLRSLGLDLDHLRRCLD